MFKLTDRNRDVYHWAGVDIELNLSFDNILLLMELFDDKSMAEHLKPVIALSMLIVDDSLIEQLTYQYRNQLLVDIFKDKLGIDLLSPREKSGMTNPNETDEDNDLPVVNFIIDAERIFASFLSDYNINLMEQQGKLMWDEFMALFNNLSEESPMKQAIYYRTCEIPKRDKHNTEERKRIKKLKELYELPEAKAIREVRELKAFQERMEANKRMYR